MFPTTPMDVRKYWDKIFIVEGRVAVRSSWSSDDMFNRCCCLCSVRRKTFDVTRKRLSGQRFPPRTWLFTHGLGIMEFINYHRDRCTVSCQSLTIKVLSRKWILPLSWEQGERSVRVSRLMVPTSICSVREQRGVYSSIDSKMVSSHTEMSASNHRCLVYSFFSFTGHSIVPWSWPALCLHSSRPVVNLKLALNVAFSSKASTRMNHWIQHIVISQQRTCSLQRPIIERMRKISSKWERRTFAGE